MGQTVGTQFEATAATAPPVPSRTDMWDGPGAKSLGNMTRQWYLFFQALVTLTEQGVTSYATSWTAQTTVTVSHNLNTMDVGAFVYNASNVLTAPQSVTVTDANTVTLTFASSFTGRVVVFG
jgi:hypothetical protein